ncbi:hypothetical protein D3Q13_22735, partial [Salmonella enterica]|nr:hypothetical protein [Salmonella enterica]
YRNHFNTYQLLILRVVLCRKIQNSRISLIIILHSHMTILEGLALMVKKWIFIITILEQLKTGGICFMSMPIKKVRFMLLELNQE